MIHSLPSILNRRQAFAALFLSLIGGVLLAACNAPLPSSQPTLVPPTPTATPVIETPADSLLPAPSDTPQPATTPIPAGEGLAPAPAPVGTVVYYEDKVDLPTYPYERFTSNELDATYNWPYLRFNLEQFEQAQPAPEIRTYRVIVLENVYLKILILPDLGGRIWQVIHKPSGNTMFYQNTVVKPSRWGIAHQLGWMAVGGLEWDLPVVEHGYEWGTTWGVLPLQHSEEFASVTVFTPSDGRVLNASIAIELRAGAAMFEIKPSITNLTGSDVSFAYWHSAALAPGPGNQLSDQLRFVLPTQQMTVHSTFNPELPVPGQPFSWPLLPSGLDLSLLGYWQQYAGLFEYPAASGPFAGVYDQAFNDGAVRIYPAEVARGSKIFSLGWHAPLDSAIYSDDGSAYVELHGGLTPDFDQQYTLPGGGNVQWREAWYPIHGIGGLSTANEVGSLYAGRTVDGLQVGFYPTRPFSGAIRIASEGNELVYKPVEVRPDQPFSEMMIAGALPTAAIELDVLDASGNLLLHYTLQ